MNFLKPKSTYKKTKRFVKDHPAGITRTILLALVGGGITFGVWFAERLVTKYDAEQVRVEQEKKRTSDWRSKNDAWKERLPFVIDSIVKANINR